MSERDEEFQKRLLITFKSEAEDHLVALASGLVELESTDDAQKRAAIIETVFREAHSLKGAARAVNVTRIESLCQAVENLFAAMKRKEVELFPELFDLLQQSVDFLRALLRAMDGEPPPVRSADGALVERLHAAAAGRKPEPVPPPSAAPEPEAPESPPLPLGEGAPPEPWPGGSQEKAPAAPPVRAAENIPAESPLPQVPPQTMETVKVATARLTTVLLQAEELLTARLLSSQRASDLRQMNAGLVAWRKEWGKIASSLDTTCHDVEERERSRRLPPEAQIQRICEFLTYNATFVSELSERLKEVLRHTERDGRAVGGMVANLLEDMKKVLMLPFSSLLEIFPKMVRDLARDRGKEVALTIRGGEIEIDRRILEEMKDPLVHLVRNCIDHGIETPEERKRAGKPGKAVIAIAITPKDGSKVELTVTDDGRGIDLGAVRAALKRVGLVQTQRVEELSPEQLLTYLFVSGVSTSARVDEISGRGLGLAIVREKVEKLSGTISVESSEGRETRFRMTLPLTVSSFRVVLVRLGEHHFAFPAAHVEQVARVKVKDIVSAEGKEMVRLKERAVPLVRLAPLLGVSEASDERPDRVQVVLTSLAEKEVAYQVDEVLNEQEVLAKNLGLQISRLPNVTGATILGSGRVVPILNVSDLVASAIKAPRAGVTVAAEGEQAAVKIGLIAEDSITSRALLKNILEGAGYRVVTAVDGVDAFSQLKTGSFDFLVSDVDMPRMNGLDLTAKVRGDHDLAELPVILVTALDSLEDRERGMEVGASAYIVKNRFDQSDLLEAIRRLV